MTGAAGIPVKLIRRIRRELPFQSIMTGYDLTEARTVTASRLGDSFGDIAITAGTPCDGVEVLVRGYSVMRGYFDDPAATADAIDAGGWLHTSAVSVFPISDSVRWERRLWCRKHRCPKAIGLRGADGGWLDSKPHDILSFAMSFR